MNTTEDTNITTEILIQIRDEMRAMRTSFERRFEMLEARMEGIEARMSATESRMDSPETRMESLEKRDSSLEKRMGLIEQSILRVESKVDSLRTQADFFQGRIDNLEIKLDSMDARNETHHQDLFRRFTLMDSDLKKFASVANEAILHYAGEMDSVREQVLFIEDKLAIAHPSE
jgi:chromosome segregation ATPase